MNTFNSDTLHRTTKIEIDAGRASTLEDADRIVERYVLQIVVGESVSESATRQAILLTAVNSASRAFLGGVWVKIQEDGPTRISWAKGYRIASAVKALGGEIVSQLDDSYPTLIIGNISEMPNGSIVLRTTWEGWSGGVIRGFSDRLAEATEFPLAGMLSGALGVSEAFQHVRKHPVAGRRSLGLSLWNPSYDWNSEAAFGEPCSYLPSNLWLIGVGHLGQAYLWALGLLPFQDRATIKILLQDFDVLKVANESTGMLSERSSLGQRKTRIASRELEALGFTTTINERPFDEATHRRADEPGVALSGLDNLIARRLLEDAGFDMVVDAGLGNTPNNYLDILVHSFPSGIKARDAYEEVEDDHLFLDKPAYQHQVQHLIESTGRTEEEIKCGLLEIAGQPVGAAFVGCAAATLVLSEVLRALNDGPRFEVMNLFLSSPQKASVANNTKTGPALNPGYVNAATVI